MNGSRKIERWETTEVLHHGGSDPSIEIEIQQPIFEGGRRGRPRLSCAVRKGSYHLRLQCRDGNTDEIETFARLLSEATTESRLAEIREQYEAACAREQAEFLAQRSQGRSRRNGKPDYRVAGGGLGRFSAQGKTSRKRRRNRPGEASSQQ